MDTKRKINKERQRKRVNENGRISILNLRMKDCQKCACFCLFPTTLFEFLTTVARARFVGLNFLSIDLGSRLLKTRDRFKGLGFDIGIEAVSSDITRDGVNAIGVRERTSEKFIVANFTNIVIGTFLTLETETDDGTAVATIASSIVSTIFLHIVIDRRAGGSGGAGIGVSVAVLILIRIIKNNIYGRGFDQWLIFKSYEIDH
jgi:hypothetical protein